MATEPTNPAPPGWTTHLPVSPSDRPSYTPSQLSAYFARINLPEPHLSNPILASSSSSSPGPSPLARTSPEHALPLLRALHLHHLASIPFENLALHYSRSHRISLQMPDLHALFVTSPPRGRGGRCMEQNGFFGTMLRSLGFEVRNAAGRVARAMSGNPEIRSGGLVSTYDGWNHMINLVRIGGEWWVVDVGMGPMGPAVVYPLRDGWEEEAIAPRRIRLQLRTIPEHAGSEEGTRQKLWCYDVNVGKGWTPTYCFTETEFLPQDYEMMSWFTSTSPKSFFTYTVLCQRLLLDGAGERIVGDLTLYNDAVRKTVGGKREVVRELKTEGERVRALEELLGVRLSEEEREGISPEQRLP